MTDHFRQLESLIAHATETSHLVSTAALLEWDQQTKLPTAAGGHRSEQVALVAKLIHSRQTDPRLGEWLSDLEKSSLVSGSPIESDVATTVRELRRQYDRQIKVPSDLIQAIAKAASTGQQVWIKAREANDFSIFQPFLEEMISLKRQQSDAIGYADSRYDALLDEYEPAAKTTDVAAVLEALRVELKPILDNIVACEKQVDSSILRRPYPIAQQRQFVKKASAKVGFDYSRGRLDVTHHPFCTEIGPNDCRITTRYDERYFSSAFFGTLHEAGHGMYEQGLRSEQYGLPPGQYCSLGIHESQSRLWENLVGRSEAFWKYFFPIAQSRFPNTLKDVSVRQFYAAVNEVTPSLIRVEADEVTYNLHIIIRFELERALIEGDLTVADLPSAWNQKYEETLSITPPDAAAGVLQDVHWSAGLIGYFPTYALGNLYASQFFETASSQLGDLDRMFAAGDFEPLLHWLNENVHKSGKCFSASELCQRVSGAKLSPKWLVEHLKVKAGKIYGLSGAF